MTSNIPDTQEEKEFRQRYSDELQKKKTQNCISSHFGLDEILDELARVKHQSMITPGRRGEQIKYEEISREILRRRNVDLHMNQN